MPCTSDFQTEMQGKGETRGASLWDAPFYLNGARISKDVNHPKTLNSHLSICIRHTIRKTFVNMMGKIKNNIGLRQLYSLTELTL